MHAMIKLASHAVKTLTGLPSKCALLTVYLLEGRSPRSAEQLYHMDLPHGLGDQSARDTEHMQWLIS